jgi:hypothetical protein
MVAIRARVTEFAVPPVHDVLVLGRQSPIGCIAVRSALQLLSAQPFVHIELDDPALSDILVRESITRRVSQERLVEFVRTRVRPLMSETEIMHLDLSVEVEVEDPAR